MAEIPSFGQETLLDIARTNRRDELNQVNRLIEKLAQNQPSYRTVLFRGSYGSDSALLHQAAIDNAARKRHNAFYLDLGRHPDKLALHRDKYFQEYTPRQTFIEFANAIGAEYGEFSDDQIASLMVNRIETLGNQGKTFVLGINVANLEWGIHEWNDIRDQIEIFLAPVAALPNVITLLGADKRQMTFQSPFLNVHDNSQIIEIGPYKEAQVKNQLNKLGRYAGWAREIVRLGGGWWLNNILLSQRGDPKDHLDAAIDTHLELFDRSDMRNIFENTAVLPDYFSFEDAEEMIGVSDSMLREKLIDSWLVNYSGRGFVMDPSFRKLVLHYLNEFQTDRFYELKGKAIKRYNLLKRYYPRNVNSYDKKIVELEQL